MRDLGYFVICLVLGAVFLFLIVSTVGGFLGAEFVSSNAYNSRSETEVIMLKTLNHTRAISSSIATYFCFLALRAMIRISTRDKPIRNP